MLNTPKVRRRRVESGDIACSNNNNNTRSAPPGPVPPRALLTSFHSDSPCLRKIILFRRELGSTRTWLESTCVVYDVDQPIMEY